MHPLLRDIVSRRYHARRVSPVTIHHVPQPVVLLGARRVCVSLWDIPPTAAAHVPVIEPLDWVLLVVPLHLVAPSGTGVIVR